MEDAVKALYIVFAMAVMVIALTVSMHLFSQAKSTADTIIYTVDSSNYYDNIKANSTNTERIVGIETIIPTLYRYYKENFLVRILDKDGKEIQVFDTELETSVRTAANTNMQKLKHEISNASDTVPAGSPPGTLSEKDKMEERYKKYVAQRKFYNDPSLSAYMFGAPWIGSTTEDARARIDYFLHGKIGYINGTKLDYSNSGLEVLGSSTSFLEKYKNTKFKETFIEYEYTGKTVSSDDGEVTLEEEDTKTKIEITYQEQV